MFALNGKQGDIDEIIERVCVCVLGWRVRRGVRVLYGRMIIY